VVGAVVVVTVLFDGTVWVLGPVIDGVEEVGAGTGTAAPEEEDGLLLDPPHAASKTTPVSAAMVARRRIPLCFLIARSIPSGPR
jgi:hypothetical protein